MNKGQAWGDTAHHARQRKNCNDQVDTTCMGEPSDAQACPRCSQSAAALAPETHVLQCQALAPARERRHARCPPSSRNNPRKLKTRPALSPQHDATRQKQMVRQRARKRQRRRVRHTVPSQQKGGWVQATGSDQRKNQGCKTLAGWGRYQPGADLTSASRPDAPSAPPSCPLTYPAPGAGQRGQPSAAAPPRVLLRPRFVPLGIM